MSEGEPTVTADELRAAQERYEPPEPRPEPRKRSIRRPAKGRQATGGRRAPTARKRASKPVAREATPEDAIRGLLQLPAAGFVLIGQRLNSTPLMADGATIIVHGGSLAEAIAKICEHDPRAMALLEKVITFGPYGEALAIAIPFAAQFVRNHNEASAPILEGFGAIPPEDIIAAAQLSLPEPSPNGQRDSGNVATAENPS
jgi:hypothetical protein